MVWIQRYCALKRASRFGIAAECVKRPAKIMMVLGDVRRQSNALRQPLSGFGESARINMHHPQRCMRCGVRGILPRVCLREPGGFDESSAIAQVTNLIQLAWCWAGVRRRVGSLVGAAVFVFATAATWTRVVSSWFGGYGCGAGPRPKEGHTPELPSWLSKALGNRFRPNPEARIAGARRVGGSVHSETQLRTARREKPTAEGYRRLGRNGELASLTPLKASTGELRTNPNIFRK
jgi:hypothetical protein